VRIEGAEPLCFASVETATRELLDLVDQPAAAPLLLSGSRAAALTLANEREAANPAQPVLVAREHWLDAETALALADPSRDFARDKNRRSGRCERSRLPAPGPQPRR
jgi:GTP cyclohydrolase II